MFAHLNPHSSDFGDMCALYSPFLHQLTMQSSLFEPGGLRPCPSYTRRRDCINLGLLCSFGGGAVTMQSPWARDYKHVASIIVSAVLNVQPFLHSWLGVLISITAWCQISLLSGYPRSAVLRALHSAVPRIVSRTPWDVEATQAWTVHILYSLPSTRDTIFYRLRQWLQGHGLWSGAAYASWHVPHTGPCSETCADWCYDFPILSAHTPRGDPSQPIPVGPPARGEGDSAFPLLSVHT